MKLNTGDIFRILTKKGYGFLQFVETSNNGLHYVRILDHISKEGLIEQGDVNRKEKWNIEFPLSIANHRKIVEFVGSFKISKGFKVAKFARSKDMVQGEFLGWYIVNRETLKRKLTKKLSNKQKELSPHGIFNDTLIIEYLENDWKLSTWV